VEQFSSSFGSMSSDLLEKFGRWNKRTHVKLKMDRGESGRFVLGKLEKLPLPNSLTEALDYIEHVVARIPEPVDEFTLWGKKLKTDYRRWEEIFNGIAAREGLSVDDVVDRLLKEN